MKDLGNASFVLGIKIYCYRYLGALGLSQWSYIKKFWKGSICPLAIKLLHPYRRVKFFQRSNVLKIMKKKERMNNVLYMLVICSLVYTQVYTHLDIAYAIDVLGRYPSDLDQRH